MKLNIRNSAREERALKLRQQLFASPHSPLSDKVCKRKNWLNVKNCLCWLSITHLHTAGIYIVIVLSRPLNLSSVLFVATSNDYIIVFLKTKTRIVGLMYKKKINKIEWYQCKLFEWLWYSWWYKCQIYIVFRKKAKNKHPFCIDSLRWASHRFHLNVRKLLEIVFYVQNVFSIGLFVGNRRICHNIASESMRKFVFYICGIHWV